MTLRLLRRLAASSPPYSSAACKSDSDGSAAHGVEGHSQFTQFRTDGFNETLQILTLLHGRLPGSATCSMAFWMVRSPFWPVTSTREALNSAISCFLVLLSSFMASTSTMGTEGISRDMLRTSENRTKLALPTQAPRKIDPPG